MSQIKEKLQADLKEAMKAQNTFLRDTIRMLNAAIKQVEVDTREVLDDTKIIKILKTAYKQREDAAIAYQQANREDLLAKEKQEMEIISTYLPKQLSDDELRERICKIIQELGATSQKDMGKVMAQTTQLRDVADGRRISAMVKELLQ
ncbi:GatB/Yqey family protein [Helicobacter fennelliae]|uniref:Transamidase GatB domain protein n=2 Tax=Helicobacter fennelliae TaxID=215 RepID=T1DVT8_9HELI|nr:GatB/YqeY domain-containing protein [Helicobacter fennelliae]GAD19038.1 transamidase GatB domain protein [Helicobacter fennelliae MRY12-0050]SQB99274.1 GatB/Yqey family protein [Helicobacter fennelliae]STP08473.1 GatB/Yqey family protein [Helicobacter fennelliae]STQ84890.1 GatB/Yqey family protein [Helicobacter fennelliae]